MAEILQSPVRRTAGSEFPTAARPKGAPPDPMLLPLATAAVFGTAGGVISLLGSVLLELIVAAPVYPPDAPRLSYGQLWITQVYAAAGAAAMLGLAWGLAIRGFPVRGFAASTAAGFAAIAFVKFYWQESQSHYGYDPSDWPCFVAPYLVACVTTAISVGGLAFGVTMRTISFVAGLFIAVPAIDAANRVPSDPVRTEASGL